METGAGMVMAAEDVDEDGGQGLILLQRCSA